MTAQALPQSERFQISNVLAAGAGLSVLFVFGDVIRILFNRLVYGTWQYFSVGDLAARFGIHWQGWFADLALSAALLGGVVGGLVLLSSIVEAKDQWKAAPAPPRAPSQETANASWLHAFAWPRDIKPDPNTLNRLGRVLHWAFVAFAAVSFLGGCALSLSAISEAPLWFGMIFGAALLLIGRALRYICSGE
jgi:hypothetical protein